MRRLVVVESPTKAKTISRFLPAGYTVEASRGHVRDLPSSSDEVPERLRKEKWAKLGVNVEKDFEPLYVVPKDKAATVKRLKELAKDADELYIATDEDREGEAIGWHILELLKPKVPVRRMVFHEITKEAIQHAVEHPREMNMALVDAQEARRILDRLVGYEVSPVLWRKLAPRLSAGRVQSVAVRLVVQREWERLAFVSAGYWGVKAAVEKGTTGRFEATMTHLGPQRIATGKDFDADTGRLADSAKNVLVLDQAKADALAARLPDAAWAVKAVEAKEQQRSPAPPFITSTLQQEAARKLGMSAKQAMRTAQTLYERGYITYMRTDSPALSDEATTAARATVEARYGRDYLTPEPRRFKAKSAGAQEAHEAIRPAGTAMKTADELGLDGPERRLYDLIWKRTVASQMANARLRLVTATLEARTERGDATFRASGRTVLFPGFFRAYVEGSDDPEAALDDKDQPLPDLREGDPLACHAATPESHETKPPARFTEASLVKKLEEEGIGRPSTYAAIMDTIVARGYVFKSGQALVPTFTALAANRLLERQFEALVDTGFTRDMEDALDRIAEGNDQALGYLQRFYSNDGGLEDRIGDGLKTLDAREMSTLTHERWEPYAVRIGKFGPYVEGETEGERRTASLPPDMPPADLSREKIEELLAGGTDGGDGVLGIHPTASVPVLLRQGPYGPYVQLGDDDGAKPKRTSLPKGVEPGELTLEQAVKLLELPRTVGIHPDDGAPILANLGRFGPYVQHNRTFASLAAEDDVLEIGLDRALELLAKKTRKGAEALRTLGVHPDDGQPVEVFEGRYGPYVKHGSVNATLPKSAKPEEVTLMEAVELLRAKAEAGGGAKKGRAKSSSAKKPAAKKAPAKPKAPKKAS